MVKKLKTIRVNKDIESIAKTLNQVYNIPYSKMYEEGVKLLYTIKEYGYLPKKDKKKK